MFLNGVENLLRLNRLGDLDVVFVVTLAQQVFQVVFRSGGQNSFRDEFVHRFGKLRHLTLILR